MLTALAPPVHLSGDRLGWTLLVCMVSDLRRGHLEVRWRFPSGGYMSESPFSVVVNSRPKGHSPVAMITVATNDWPAYRCSVNHKRRPKVTKGRLISSSGKISVEYQSKVSTVLFLMPLKCFQFQGMKKKLAMKMRKEVTYCHASMYYVVVCTECRLFCCCAFDCRL